MNTFIIAGNLTKDPVLKTVTTPNGPVSKCTFTVAVRRSRATNQVDNADFIPCTAWRLDADNIVKFFSKGRKILIQGHVTTGTFVDGTGATKFTYDWVVDHWEFCYSPKSDVNTNLDAYLHAPETDSGKFEEVDTGTYVDASPASTTPSTPEVVERTSAIEPDLPF